MTKRDIPYILFIMVCAVALFMSGRYSAGISKAQPVAAPASSTIIVNVPTPSPSPEAMAFVERWEAKHSHEATVTAPAPIPETSSHPVTAPKHNATPVPSVTAAAPQVKAPPAPLNIVLEEDPAEVPNPYKDHVASNHPGF